MYYQIWSCAAKVPTQGGRIFDLRAVFCILPLAFFFFTTTHSLAAPAPAGWAATYGGANRDEGHSIQQTSDGGYVAAGGTKSFGAGNGDLWVLKLGPDGAVEWQRTYGGINWDFADFIQEVSEGGYIVVGETESFGAGNEDIWVLKLRSDGAVDPSCNFERHTSVSVRDTSTDAESPNVEVKDSSTKVLESTAAVKDTSVIENIQCTSTAIEKLHQR